MANLTAVLISFSGMAMRNLRLAFEGVGCWGTGVTATGCFVAFLVVGCFLDAIPAITVVGTILEPMARAAHMNPVHFPAPR